jgi:hypothetical protein
VKTLKSEEIYKHLTDLIKNAKSSVKISSAWLKGNMIGSLLLHLQKDVELEVILRASELKDLLITDDRVFEEIRKKKGTVYLNNRLHAKFILVDDCKAVVGSANFTGAGLSDYDSGNIEAAVYYDDSDDPGEIRELVDYFEKIKKDSSKFDDNLIGFAINPVKSDSFEFILIEPGIKERSYVKVNHPEGDVLAEITTIYSYDMGFFANPFSAGESAVFGSIDEFKTLFSSRKDKDWKKAAVWSYLNENGDKVRIAVAEILGIVTSDGKLETNMEPFDVGEPVYAASKEILNAVSKTTWSGKSMVYPVEVGVFKGTDQKVFIDAKEVITKHMLILGTTGSGKSHFTKKFLSRLLQQHPVQILIFDPHGEYYEELKESVSEEDIDQVVFEETIFPVYPEEVEDIIKGIGLSNIISGNSKVARNNKSRLAAEIKPSLKATSFKEKNLYDILLNVKTEDDEAISEKVASVLGKEILESQVSTYNEIDLALKSSKRVIIFNFSHVTDPATRVNLAGLVMQELFEKNKKDKKERIVVLEEAHNFAPESSYGDVSAGRNNLALTMARKIASEGRKFNLGLIVITQRPAQVSKYVLSQANTQAMFRTMNESDLKAIESYVEFAGKSMIGLLPSLRTGVGVLSGLGVPFPLVVEVG